MFCGEFDGMTPSFGIILMPCLGLKIKGTYGIVHRGLMVFDPLELEWIVVDDGCERPDICRVHGWR
jgi:hypothetical protein